MRDTAFVCSCGCFVGTVLTDICVAMRQGMVNIYWVGSGLRFQKSSVTVWVAGYILFHRCP